MKTGITVKLRYEAPKTEMYETLSEGLICSSEYDLSTSSDFIEDEAVYGDGMNLWGK